MRVIVFYRSINGACPVEEFLDSLTGKQAQKVTWVLRLIEEQPTVPRQYFKKLIDTDNLWEVRIQFGNNIFRLLGFFDEGRMIVLTNGFAKITKKTPRREIDVAKRRRHDYRCSDKDS